MTSWSAWVDGELDAIRAEGRWRDPRPLADGGTRTTLAGQPVVSFASNDYLGLSQHPAVVAAAHGALDRYGAGSGASRLVVGSRPVHHELEAELAVWKHAEAAVLLPTGYHANLAAIGCLGAGATIVSDELNHASIIDGCRLARAHVATYRHGDVDHAAALVAGAPGRAVVVSDTVFSMDGDVAPVVELSAMCARLGALLVLDDAHTVLGAPEPDPTADVVRVGTLSKALGSVGGFVAARRPVVQLLVNRARPYIFTTAPAPADAAAALAALAIVTGAEGDELRRVLRAHVDAIAPGHPSPIVPVIIGSEEAALAAAAGLLAAGMLVPAIRPPTVPPGTSRLRVTLSAAHDPTDVKQLAAALADLHLSA